MHQKLPEHRGVGILIDPRAALFDDAKTGSRTLGRVNNAEEAWVRRRGISWPREFAYCIIYPIRMYALLYVRARSQESSSFDGGMRLSKPNGGCDVMSRRVAERKRSVT